MRIEPKNKKERIHLERMIKHLSISDDGEIFILKCILSFDWNRLIILGEIQNLKQNPLTKRIYFKINIIQPNMLIDYSCISPFAQWDSNKDLEAKKYDVYSQMQNYCCSKY